MKNLFFTLTFLISAISIAQSSVTVSGKLTDKTSGEPLEFATVSFISTDNSEVPQGGITKADGTYSIAVKPGTYTVKWEFFSFKPVILNNQQITEDKNYGTTTLDQQAATLDAAIITLEKTTVDIRLDKKIYNVGKDLTVKGGTASDVLNNVPSVTVDVEGAVALRGNENVRILIDGRPSALVGFSGSDALRQIPADAIERIEVITSPSARYDAEGTAGILNIILRKEKLVGFNGSLQANVGIPANAGLSLNANYRTTKFNWFTNTGYNYRANPGNSKSFTNFGNGVRLIDEVRDIDRSSSNFFTSIGSEYYINPRSSIIGNIVYRFGKDDDTNTNTILRSGSGNTSPSTRRIENELEDDNSIQFSVNYNNNIDDEGQKLSGNVQYSVSNDDGRAFITERNINNNVLNDNEFTLTGQTETEAQVQIDYELPIGESVNVEAGYRGNYRDIDNSFFLAEEQQLPDGTLAPGGQLIPDSGLNNTFIYSEFINAAYVQYGKKIKKLSLFGGLRYENTAVTIEQETTNEETKKNFGGFFPTVNLGYELNESTNFTFGYNRRIQRPRGRLLNPFPSRSSESSIFQGNVDLNPVFANAIDIGFLKRWSKVTFSTSVYANQSDDNWEFIQQATGQTTDNGDPIIRRFPVNLSKEQRAGYEFNVNYKPYKWWNINTDFNVFYVKTNGSFENQNFDFTNTSYSARLNQKFTIDKKTDFQANFNYRGASANAQGTQQGIPSLNLAFSRELFNDKATLTANLSDVFNSQKRQSTTVTPTFVSDSEFQWRQRQFTVSFTYRFNQKKKQQERPSNNGGGDDFEFQG